MAKRSVAVCVVLASCLGVQLAVAQTKMKAAERALWIGPVANVNFATFTGSDASGAKTRTAFSFGGAATINLSSSFFIQLQGLYSMKGASTTVSTTSGPVKVDFKLNYVEVPLLLGVRLVSDESSIRPYLVAGPTVGYLASCKISGSSGGASAEFNCDDPSLGGAKTRSIDYGVTGGAGVEVPIGRARLVLGGRYGLGFGQPFEGSNIKNAGFSAGIGLFVSTSR
jgi:hypothetical protein